MSTNNIEFIQNNVYANFETGNIPALMAVLDENISWIHHGPRELIPFAGEWQGVEGAGQMLQTVAVVDGIRDVTEKMHKHGVRRLPVVDAAGRLAGIVSLDDILVLLGKELGDVAETIENQFAQERVMTSLRRAREG